MPDPRWATPERIAQCPVQGHREKRSEFQLRYDAWLKTLGPISCPAQMVQHLSTGPRVFPPPERWWGFPSTACISMASGFDFHDGPGGHTPHGQKIAKPVPKRPEPEEAK